MQGGADSCGSGYSGELSPDDLEDMGVIGSGSSGVAKKVHNRRTGQTLVLKVINFDVSSDTTRKQITTELRTLHDSTHSSVVRWVSGRVFHASGNRAMHCPCEMILDSHCVLLKAIQRTA